VFVVRALALVARGERAAAKASLERAAVLDPQATGLSAAAARVEGRCTIPSPSSS
jgi:hypothetical protein